MGVNPGSARSEHAEFQEYEVKATFLYYLTKFVDWPETSPDSRHLRLCVIGHDSFGSLLDYFEGQIIQGRILVITRLAVDSPIDPCHLAFIGTEEQRWEESLLARAQLARVLTVGESTNFTRHGGIVRFHVDDNRVQMEINATAAKAAEIAISAKLMSLVEIVRYPLETSP
jgi:hypothetical protein